MPVVNTCQRVSDGDEIQVHQGTPNQRTCSESYPLELKLREGLLNIQLDHIAWFDDRD